MSQAKEETGDTTRIPLRELKRNMELEGIVTKIEIFGAFIDVGAEREGMAHISMLKKAHVNRVEEIVQVGQKVTVWVHRSDPQAGRLELSMVRPVTLKWKDIRPGMKLQGKVVRLENFGAFVEVGAERPGLVHVSELSNEYVTNPADIVSVGDAVEVSVLDVNRKKRQMRLSMKETAQEILEEEFETEELPTAMELALREALEQSNQDEQERIVSETSRQQARRQMQDEILSRTLKQKLRTATSTD